jgi:hypothetical protein
MLEYNLTRTPIFSADCAVPNEAEMFVITLALLLVHGVAFTEMGTQTLEFESNELEAIALCIEEEVPLFTRDLGFGQRLRKRLSDFVGLQITYVAPGNCVTSALRK